MDDLFTLPSGQLWIVVGDVASGKSVQVTKTPLLATLVTAIDWTPDGKSIVAVLVPEGRGPAPTHGKNGIEDGPAVRLTESRAIPQVIHPSLLEDPHDKAMLKYYTTGQLALIDAGTRWTTSWPGFVASCCTSEQRGAMRALGAEAPRSLLSPPACSGADRSLGPRARLQRWRPGVF
jgi:hypothetical protein